MIGKGLRYYRKIIRITADDSPNVKLAKEQIAKGLEPTGEMVIPGILSWQEYQKRQKMYDDVQRTVSLEARFHKGKLTRLFPSGILDESVRAAAKLKGIKRRPTSMGIDAAEGGDNSSWSVVDDLGLVFQYSRKTSDTSDIPGITIGFIKEYSLDPQDVLFDRGGGGKQHTDALRRRGYFVRSVGFGEAVTNELAEFRTTTAKVSTAKKVEMAESRYTYKNRRAQLYGLLAIAVENGWALPQEYGEVLRQLSLISKDYDGEGRLILPPKHKPSPNYTGVTLQQLLGCSPDEADGLALANYIRVKPVRRVVVGALR